MGSELRRLYAPQLPPHGGEVQLDRQAAHHAHVLRLSVGDSIRLFDGHGHEADAELLAVDEEGLRCRASAPRRAQSDLPTVVLVQAMPKGGKLDDIVRMTTEIGVSAIYLAMTDRTVARPDAKRAEKRTQRLRRVAREAARQAGRADVPEIHEPEALGRIAARAPEHSNRVILWEGAERRLAACLEAAAGPTWLCVGPEGGFGEMEVQRLQSEGWQAASLGPTILRVETAAPVGAALCLEHLRALAS
jgi:16S rRNA (uracil1498-N3)-methyltransferase